MNKKYLLTALLFLAIATTKAQQSNTHDGTAAGGPASNTISVSNADPGIFPYIKTLPNFYARNGSDSVTIEQNRVYFYDGKAFFTIDGQVSAQILSLQDDKKKRPSEFQIIQEFDKIVSTLGGKKLYAGKFPEEQLQKSSGLGIVDLASKHQVAPNAYYGVIEYVIKTPQKELWFQLVPSSIESGFYNLLVVEKQSQLLTTNINKENLILKALENKGKAVTNFYFESDNSTLLTESKDELLNIVGIFQAHPDWKIKMEINNAPLGKPGYILSLTEKRAAAISQELISLGVKPASIQVSGLGDTKPLASNDTEQGRRTNTRVDISKM